jgi:hypothetical protein
LLGEGLPFDPLGRRELFIAADPLHDGLETKPGDGAEQGPIGRGDGADSQP